MPRFRDIKGDGIRPPMSYVEFERPCRLGLTLIDMGGVESTPPSSFFELYERVLEVET